MPSQPVDVIKRSSRWAGQRWLLDAVIGLVGPDWDQGRVAYYAAACGQDSQVDFTAVRPRIRKYDDLAREFSKAARRRELLARDAEHQDHRASARESYFTAAVLYGAAQWAIEANTEFNLLLDRKKTEWPSAANTTRTGSCCSAGASARSSPPSSRPPKAGSPRAPWS